MIQNDKFYAANTLINLLKNNNYLVMRICLYNLREHEYIL